MGYVNEIYNLPNWLIVIPLMAAILDYDAILKSTLPELSYVLSINHLYTKLVNVH